MNANKRIGLVLYPVNIGDKAVKMKLMVYKDSSCVFRGDYHYTIKFINDETGIMYKSLLERIIKTMEEPSEYRPIDWPEIVERLKEMRGY